MEEMVASMHEVDGPEFKMGAFWYVTTHGRLDVPGAGPGAGTLRTHF